jgi:type II secretory pathway component PulF
MATYVVTLKHGFGKTGKAKTSKAKTENRTVKVVAADSKSARQIAETEGWSAIQAVPVADSRTKRQSPFPRKPLIVMCKSLASMLDAQIPLPKALDFYNAHLTREDLRLTLKSIAVAVERGDEVHKAFAATGRFDSTFVGLVRAGTMSSNLSGALRALARRMKINAEFQSKIRKAILTPLCILAFLWLIMIYSMTGLVPGVEKMLSDMHVDPDPFSGAIFLFSHFFKAVYVPTSIGIIVFGLALWQSFPFRTAIFTFLLKHWKLLRQIILGFRQLTFIGTFEMLLSNNVPISDALETCALTVKKTPLEKELLNVRAQMLLGLNLGEAIRKYTSVDPQLSHMVEIGEKASNLTEQLRLLRDLYEEETEQRIEFFTGFVGVASKILTVSIIGMVYIGTYMPIIMAGPKMMTSGR